MAKTKLQKFGNFLMYGGWLLVVIVIFAIVVAVSYYTK
jgi:hypothetical protein